MDDIKQLFFKLGILVWSIKDDKVKIWIAKELPTDVKKKNTEIAKQKIYEILGIRNVEVYETDMPRALAFFPVPAKKEVTQVEKTDRIRPLKGGISIGHVEITAGSLGGFFWKGNKKYIFSNAHVFHPNPFSNKLPVDRRILQPAPYDGGTELDHIANITYYVKIYDIWESPRCPISRFIDFLYRGFKRISRVIELTVPNYIDYAEAELVDGVDCEDHTFNGLPYSDEKQLKFIGLGFAGSNEISLVCKVPKYVQRNWCYPTTNIYREGDIVHKDGRTTCHATAEIIDPSVSAYIWYGYGYVAYFEDLILTKPLLQGGDSGSPVFVEEYK